VPTWPLSGRSCWGYWRLVASFSSALWRGYDNRSSSFYPDGHVADRRTTDQPWAATRSAAHAAAPQRRNHG
ncbi:MAG: hypothetical protein WBA27_08660, partial [Pseudomonas neustonica]